MKNLKIKSIILLLVTMLYIFSIPNKSLPIILISFIDLPSLIIMLLIPTILILLKKDTNIIEFISIIFSLIYSIIWGFIIPMDKIYLVLLPLIYSLLINILIPIIKNLIQYKLSFSIKIRHR